MRTCTLAAAFLLVSILSAQTWPVIIDSGSATDSNFIGGDVTVAPPLPGIDPTSRYGDFRYLIPANNELYVITFKWVERTVTAVGQRLFQVRVNDQILFDRLDIFQCAGGAQKMVSRSVVIMGSEQLLKIEFITQKRSATIANLEITPYSQIFGGSTAVIRACDQTKNPGAPTADCTGLYLVELPWPDGTRKKLLASEATPEMIASPVFATTP